MDEKGDFLKMKEKTSPQIKGLYYFE